MSGTDYPLPICGSHFRQAPAICQCPFETRETLLARRVLRPEGTFRREFTLRREDGTIWPVLRLLGTEALS